MMRNLIVLYISVLVLTGAYANLCHGMEDTDGAGNNTDSPVDTATPPVDTATPPVDTDMPNVDSDALNLDTAAPDEPASEPEETSLKDEISEDRMPTLDLSVTPIEGAIGDAIQWQMKAKRKVGDRVLLPEKLSFGELEIVDKSSVVESTDGDWEIQLLTVQLISFETGEFVIPPQKLTVVDVSGNMSEIMTDSATVVISSLIANEPEPTIKEDTGEGVTVWEEDYTLLYILIGIGAAAVVALLTLLGRKLWSMRAPKPGPPPPPPRPAEDIALEKLDGLRTSPYLAEGMHKQYHLVLSEALREYLGNRYKFDSLELSTEELIDKISIIRLSPTLHTEIVTLLSETDLVKFAKVIPTMEESQELLKEAYRLVHDTTPKRESPQNEDGADGTIGEGHG